MLDLNGTTLERVVNSAKIAAQGDQRWLNAIDRAAYELTENPYVEALDDHTLLIGSSSSGVVYTSNGSCQCQAFLRSQPCYHRAMSRLYQRYTEAQNRTALLARQAAAQAALDECYS